MVQGGNLFLKLGDGNVAASKECSLSMDMETISVCSPIDGAAKDYVGGTYGWSVSASGLCVDMTYSDNLVVLFQNREKVDIVFYEKDGTMKRKGKALITALRFVGTLGTLATYSITLTGCGDLDRDKTAVGTFDWEHISDQAIVRETTGETYTVEVDGSCIICGDFTLANRTNVEVNVPAGYMVLKGDDQLQQAVESGDMLDDHITNRFSTGKTVINCAAGTHYWAISVPDAETEQETLFIYE